MKDYVRKVTDIVKLMNIDTNPVDKTIRNALLAGLASPEVHTECCKEDIEKLDSKRVIQIAEMFEERDRLRQKLSQTATQTLPKSAMMVGKESADLHKLKSESKKR